MYGDYCVGDSQYWQRGSPAVGDGRYARRSCISVAHKGLRLSCTIGCHSFPMLKDNRIGCVGRGLPMLKDNRQPSPNGGLGQWVLSSHTIFPRLLEHGRINASRLLTSL